MPMTIDELDELDKQIVSKREEREALNQEALRAKQKAKVLSAEIRDLEASMPTPKQIRGIVMRADAASLKRR